jgi:hypothetical protein
VPKTIVLTPAQSNALWLRAVDLADVAVGLSQRYANVLRPSGMCVDIEYQNGELHKRNCERLGERISDAIGKRLDKYVARALKAYDLYVQAFAGYPFLTPALVPAVSAALKDPAVLKMDDWLCSWGGGNWLEAKDVDWYGGPLTAV